MPFGKSFSVFGDRFRVLVGNLLIVLLCPIDVVEHGQGDEPDWKSFRLHPKIFHCLLDLFEQLHRGVPGEYHPLEHDWFSVEIVQFSV